MLLHEVGKGGGKISGGKSKTINRNVGVGGSSTRIGKGTKIQSDSERDSEWESWMEAQMSRNTSKTSKLVFIFINQHNFLFSQTMSFQACPHCII